MWFVPDMEEDPFKVLCKPCTSPMAKVSVTLGALFQDIEGHTPLTLPYKTGLKQAGCLKQADGVGNDCLDRDLEELVRRQQKVHQQRVQLPFMQHEKEYACRPAASRDSPDTTFKVDDVKHQSTPRVLAVVYKANPKILGGVVPKVLKIMSVATSEKRLCTVLSVGSHWSPQNQITPSLENRHGQFEENAREIHLTLDMHMNEIVGFRHEFENDICREIGAALGARLDKISVLRLV